MGVEQDSLPITLEQQLWKYLEVNDSQGLAIFLEANPSVDLNQPYSKKLAEKGVHLFPLQYTAQQGFKETLMVLLKNKTINVNLGDLPPLHLAVLRRDVEIVKLLLAHKDINLLLQSASTEFYAMDYACTQARNEIEKGIFGIGITNTKKEKINAIVKAIFEKHVQANIPIPYDFKDKYIKEVEEVNGVYTISIIFHERNDNFKLLLMKSEWKTLLASSKNFQHFYWLGVTHLDGIKNSDNETILEANKTEAYTHLKKCAELFLSQDENTLVTEDNLKFFNILKTTMLDARSEFGFHAIKSPVDGLLAKTKFTHWETYAKLDCAELWLKLASENKPSDTPDTVIFPADCYLNAIKAIRPDENNLLSELDKDLLEKAILLYGEFLTKLDKNHQNRNLLILDFAKLLNKKYNLMNKNPEKTINFLQSCSDEIIELNYYLAELHAKNYKDATFFKKSNYKELFHTYHKKIPDTHPLKQYLLAKFIADNTLKIDIYGPEEIIEDLRSLTLPLPDNAYGIDEEEIIQAREFAKTILKNYQTDKFSKDVRNKALSVEFSFTTIPSAPPPDSEESLSELSVNLSTAQQNLQKELASMPKQEVTSTQNPTDSSSSKSSPQPSAVHIESQPESKLSKNTNFWKSEILKKSTIALSKELEEEKQSIACEEEELLNRLIKLKVKKEGFEEKVKQFKISKNTKIFEGLKINPKEQLKKQFKEEKTKRREKLTDEKLDKSYKYESYKYELTLIKNIKFSSQ